MTSRYTVGSLNCRTVAQERCLTLRYIFKNIIGTQEVDEAIGKEQIAREDV